MNDLTNRLCEVLGEFTPGKHLDKNPSYQIRNEFTKQKIKIQEILIKVDKNDDVPAFILQPNDILKERHGILCLHQTTDDTTIGAKEAAGIKGQDNYKYAFELAKLGFVTIAPDYPFFGSYNISIDSIYNQYGYQSISMKAIINHMAAIDILQSLPNVLPGKVGCIGHSLGGTNALLLSFFDQRITVIVISAGITTFKRYAETSPNKDLSKWASKDKYMPNVKTKYDNDYKKMPFDFPELLASMNPRPIFISAPKNDEIFDFSGAMECIKFASENYKRSNCSNKFKFAKPNCMHDFPIEVRQIAYNFLEEELCHNGDHI